MNSFPPHVTPLRFGQNGSILLGAFLDLATPSPKRLGRFELIRPLGQGGMGQVFLARDPSIGREVAIKTISSDMVQTPKARERFLNEAKAAGTLSHPNLITVHEFGEDEGTLFLVMEYLEGEDLSALLRRRALPPAQALDLMAQVCDGLAYAHAKGVLHRDVKPSNVRIVEQSGRLVAKLMDFGVARLPDSQLTGTGDRVGTLSYMAPEYLRGGQPTIQCDLYPVGMMLHEALTGSLPQLGLTRPGGFPRPARTATQTTSDLPARLAPLVHRALAGDPGERFPSAEAFATALRAAQKQDTGGGPRLDLPPITGPEPTRSGGLGWLAAGVLAIASIVAWKLTRPTSPAPALPTPAKAPVPPPNLSTTAKPEVPSRPTTVAPTPVAATTTQAPPPSAPTVDLNAAETEVKDHPQDALDQANLLLQQQPGHGRALALKIASLYWLGRYEDLQPAFEDAQRAGLGGDQLGAYPVLHAMLDDQHANHRIPPPLFQRLRAYLPVPRGEDQRPDDTRRSPGRR